MTKTKSFVWGMRAIATFVERDFGTYLIGRKNMGGDRALEAFETLWLVAAIVRNLDVLCDA
jgi:hypothetical protein